MVGCQDACGARLLVDYVNRNQYRILIKALDISKADISIGEMALGGEV